MMRYLPLILALYTAAWGGDAYPLWDGHEPIADYARRVNLPPTKTLDLGNGVTLELVLIPAGEFMMGVPNPQPVDVASFKTRILWAEILQAASGLLLLIFISVPIAQVIRKRQRLKYSLAWLLAMTTVAGGVIMSVLYCGDCHRSLSRAHEKFRAASDRYAYANDDEKPAHKVVLTHPFYFGKFPVTQKQYQQVTGTNPSEFKGSDNPVELIQWGQAQDFCTRVKTSQQLSVRLPTEAEWEFACRAGSDTDFYSGDSESDLARVAWYGGNSKNRRIPSDRRSPIH